MLDFTGAELLSFSQESKFLGEAFHYGNVRRFTIQGIFHNPENGEGVSETWAKISGFLEDNEDYNGEIMLRGHSFGSGKIINIDFEESNDVRVKRYIAEIETYVESSMSNLEGSYYNGVSIDDWHLIDNINETFEFVRNEDSRKTFQHQVNIRYHGLSTLELAKTSARNLIETNVFDIFFDFDTLSKKNLYQENINLIDNSYSVTKTIEFSEDKGNYSVEDRTHTMEMSEDGIVNITESAIIKGFGQPDQYASALLGLEAELAGVRPRCLEVFESFGIVGYELSNIAIQKSKSLDKFSSVINYSATYTNDPKVKDTYTHSYVQEIEKNDGYYYVTENGSILGLGPNHIIKFERAKNAWLNIKTNIESNVNAFYSSKTTSFLPLHLAVTQNTFSDFRGTIDYSRRFTNDPNYIIDENIRKLEIIIDDKLPVQTYNLYPITNYKELLQKQNINSIATRSLSATVIGRRTAELDHYLNFIKDHINRYIPDQKDPYITDVSYNFNPFLNQLGLTLTWNYFIDENISDGVINGRRFV